jgi:16S rRNA (cytosine1402-N4)-methyltransferase
MKGNKDNILSGSPPIKSLYHVPVMLDEVVEYLSIKPSGVYVDCTFGGGGHTGAILKHLSDEGQLIAFDQDEDAKANLPDDKRIHFLPHNFRHLNRFLKLSGCQKVDGIIADLGVSSHQFDEGSRGFSTRFDADLDMRMDQRQDLRAFDILKTYPEKTLHKLFEKFGEVTNAKTLARTIVERRSSHDIITIEGFKNAVAGVVKGAPNKYFSQVFQALRIEVNDELGALRELLQQIPQALKSGGRILIITFHSLEDRLVKTFFRDGTFEVKNENPFETDSENINPLKTINKKPIQASAKEVQRNPRARSAKLRVAERK